MRGAGSLWPRTFLVIYPINPSIAPMKTKRIIVIAALLGLLAAGYLLMNSRVPAPAPNATTTAAPESVAKSPARRSDAAALPRAPRLLSWQEQLPALQEMKQLFGAGSEERMKKMQEFVETLPLASMPEALRKLSELQALNPTDAGRDLEMRMVRRWADHDARSAAGWAAQSRGPHREELLGAVGSSWARQDFKAAADWATRLDDGKARQKATTSVAYEVIDSNPTAALKLAVDLPADPERDKVIAWASAAWADRAPGEAASWAKLLPEEKVRQQTISAIALTWAAKDPSAAATLALESLPDGELQDHTVLYIARRWASTEPAAATAWVKQFPEGDLRKATLEGIAVDQKRIHGSAAGP